MKKILIVGGGVNQMPLVLASKHEGYYTIVVDYAGKKCPAYTVADRFYNVSTQDEDAICEIAKIEDIDGIISNSEPSMLIVNSIAEKLGLNGNTVNGVNDLISKSRFRDLQRRAGVYAPNHFETETVEDALSVSERLCYPIIVKPSESSASRGCKVIEEFDREIVTKAFLDCQQLSRDQKVVVEEFVEMPSFRTIEGDVFLFGDEILWEGLYYTTRPNWAPMIPMTYTGSMLIEDNKLDSIKTAITKVFDEANIQFGEFNIEGFFTCTDEFFIIEINARQGGNFLPAFLQRFTGIDYNRLLVTTSVNDVSYWKETMSSERKNRNYIMCSAYSQKDGIYKGLAIDPSIRTHVTKVTELLSAGDEVKKCVDGTSIVASILLEFDSMEELYEYSPKIIDSIHVELS
jgi:biotin carboxylase